MAGNQKVTTENINEVILRLLKLNSGVEIDYQTYYQIIKKKLASARLIGKDLPREEDELLREEFKRVKNKTGRFKVKTSKVKVTPPPSAGPERGGGGGMPPRSQGSIVKSKSGKITADNFFLQNFIDPVKVRDITEKSSKISESSLLERINKNLDSIVDTLTNINKQNGSRLEESRKEEEDKRRKSREGELESKTFDGIKKAISVVTKPFQSIWDKILNFIKNIILGRILIKLVNWIADPNNQGKIKSIIRFFKDWWPALLGSYVLFGTSFGKFVRGIVGMLGRFIFQIGKIAIPQLLKFIRTPLGKGIALFTAGATIPAMFPGTVNDQERKTSKQPGSSQDKIKSLQQQKANLNIFQRLQGKGSEIDEQIYYLQTGKTKSYGFNGGGFSGGIISGPKGRDRVPAMLTDGEFVMSVGAVNKYGVETLEAMNAAGGGTNEPKVVGGKTYAAGGGYVGNVPINWLTSNMSDEGAKSLAQSYSSMGSNSLGLTSDEWYKAIKRYKGVPDFDKLLGEGKPFTKWESTNKPLSKEQLDTIRQVVRGNNPGSAYSTPRSINAPKPTPTLNPRIPTLASELSPSYFLRGQSSLLPQLKKQSSKYRYVPPDGGRPFRATGLGGDLDIQRLANQSGTMRPRVPGGFGNLRSLGVEMLSNYLMERGFDKINAMIMAQKIDEGKKLTGDERKNYVERLRNIVDREERWQRGFGGVFDSIVGLGKESSSQKQSKVARVILEGIGSGAYQSGAIKGGWGLKKQEFKDAPKTQVMTDDKGRPFVGHKAMRNGKLTYVRGTQPGTGTTNPLEALGRMINPNAYKENDARLARGKHREAMVNSLESLRAQGASIDTQERMMMQVGGNLKVVQNDLNYRKKIQEKKKTQERIKISNSQKRKSTPKPMPKPDKKYIPSGGAMGGKRGSGARPSQSGTKPQSFPPTHSSKSTLLASNALGVKK